MNSYSIYRVTETIRIMLFIVASILIFNFYPVTAIMIILLALLNDIPILAIAYDRTIPESKPVRWEMKKVLILSTILGCVGIISSFFLLFIAKEVLLLDLAQLQSFVFLKLSIAGHQILFVTRTPYALYSKPYPAPILLTAILFTQLIAVILVGFGIIITPLPWSYIGLIWGYTLVWMFLADQIKLLFYRHMHFAGTHHQKFLKRMKEPFHSHAKK
jgi:H+-transporting ATPase